MWRGGRSRGFASYFLIPLSLSLSLSLFDNLLTGFSVLFFFLVELEDSGVRTIIVDQLSIRTLREQVY